MLILFARPFYSLFLLLIVVKADAYYGGYQFNPQIDSTQSTKGVAYVSELQVEKKLAKKQKKKKEKKVKTAEELELLATKKWIKEKSNAQKEAAKKERLAEKEQNKQQKAYLDTTATLTHAEEIRALSKTNYKVGSAKKHPSLQKNCQYAFDVTDELTGLRKMGLYPRHFFSYTPEEYRKFLAAGEFIRCEGFLSKSSKGNMALNINYYVASRQAISKFGNIRKRSPLILYTIDNKEFVLMTYEGAKAVVEGNNTYYQCSYAINKLDLKKLKKVEIDRIKISFEEGFQTYDIYYLDFLRDQFSCFD